MDKNTLEMHYNSDRRMGDLVPGLVEQSLIHFNQKGTVEMKAINEARSEVLFIIRK